jgi:succinoglycan biosynthesis protein ExoM
MKITVCIATHRRADRLRRLLDDLIRQELPPEEIVVVDNDRSESARAVVEDFATRNSGLRVVYGVQPERNIARTRNRTVELAGGDWLAFVDDDERAPETWLKRLVESASKYDADGVLGPVEPIVPEEAPGWIRRGRFYDFPRLRTGEAVPLNRMRFGNVLLRGAPLRAEPGPFDVAYELATGEDGDLLVRLVHRGARIIWCDEAVVWEPVESKRLALKWLLLRAMSGGQEFAMQTIRGRYGPIGLSGRLRLFLRALVQMLLAALLAALCLPLGRHRSAAWLVKVWANFGKLTAFWRARYRAYA